MVLDLVKEIMRLYTGVSKTTSSLFYIKDLDHPIYTTGLNHSTLIEYLDLQDVITYMKDSISRNKTIQGNIYYTYHTSNNYAYNIIIIRQQVDSEGTPVDPDLLDNAGVVVTGPILCEMPTDNLINSKALSMKLSVKEKHEFIEILYTLPYFSQNDIEANGKILFMTLNPASSNLSQIMQIKDGRLQEAVDYAKYITTETKNCDHVYQFLLNLCNYVIHGNSENISDAVFENMHLLTPYFTKGDNYRSLKDICLIGCVVSYCFSLRTNFSYETLFEKLWNSIMAIEKTNNVSDIFGQTIATIKDFSQEVKTSTNHYSLHTNRIIQYINTHYAEKITLEALSEYMHLSPVYISSLLKKETHVSLSDHINLIRINKSKQMLIFGTRSISDISYEVGYNHQTHYNKLFRKYEGMTPREYRNTFGYKEKENFQIS